MRWDSLGEYLALAVALEDLGTKTKNAKALAVGEALSVATGKLLDNNKSPGRKVKQLDKCSAQMRLGWTSAQDAAVCSDCLSCNRPTVRGNLQPSFAVAFELGT